jgi:HD-GYP domain-containing protein (c-di-GMP phosphodiesterase class II)
MNETQKSDSQEKIKDREMNTNKDAVDLLFRFNWASRISKIYEENNLIFVRQIKLLYDMLKKPIEEHGEAKIKISQNTLFLNDIKLKFGFSSYFLLKYVMQEFDEREIGVLAFTPGLTEEELKKFVILFAEKPENSDKPLERFHKKCLEAGIDHIVMEQISPHDQSSSKKKDAMKMYFLSITHLKEIFEKYQKDDRLPLITTRRLMQALFSNIADNETYVHGLTTIKNFDEYTLNHSVNVCLLSISLGKRLGLDRNELMDLGISAFFHDYGKLDIPKEILLKPGKLDKKERELIEHHPQYGAEKLIQMKTTGNMPIRAIHVAMEHHAQEGRGGYPTYTKKNNINLFSKIVHIADVFDAITTKRPYRTKDFSRDEALKMMLEKIGEEFDPLILKIFVNMMGACPVGTLVLLNTGEIGIIFETNEDPTFMLRPKVKLITDQEGNKIDGEVVDLAKRDPEKNVFVHSIIKNLDNNKYNVPIPDYFVTAAHESA